MAPLRTQWFSYTAILAAITGSFQSVKLSGVELLPAVHVGTPARHFTVYQTESISSGTGMRHVMRKRITSAAGAISPCRFRGRVLCIRSRATAAEALTPDPLQPPLHSQPEPPQPQSQAAPMPQLGPPIQLPTSFDAFQVTPPYRTKELEGLNGITGVGPQSVAAFQSIGISSKGELLYLHKVICGGNMGVTKAFLRVRSRGPNVWRYDRAG